MSSSNIAAAMLEKTKELDLINKEQEMILLKINNLHKKLQKSPEAVENSEDNSLETLKLLYTQAMDLSNREANICDFLASQVDSLIELKQPPPLPPLPPRRKTMAKGPKKQVKTMSNTSTRRSLEGEMVAAKVNAEKDEWIVARVVRLDEESKEFEIIDEEPDDNDDVKEDERGEKKYKVGMGSIIPLPRSDDPTGAPEFPPGTHVLAVYPETTTLYKARVVHGHGHSKRKKHEYVLEFDDDEDKNGNLPQRKVAFHNVVALNAANGQ
ncbi:hypothetical protein PIB30_073273 [Stylosanthes scabra]|uniref:SGF29 C-terminal domain-containing protein n=1 Tax=Stylosanthes scabra TaxID=79078 RepID=A0ABU6WSR6_9FABA|nr:hypothetical protein [Stylosanthes scabra]